MSTQSLGPVGQPLAASGPAATLPAAVLVDLAVALAVGAVVAWRGRRFYRDPTGDADTAARLRTLRRRGLLGGWLLTAGVGRALDVVSSVAAALGGVVPESVAAVVAPTLAYLLPAVPVAVAVRVATVPYRRAVRGLRVRYRDAAAWELERDGVGLGGVATAAVAISLAPPGWPRALVAVALGVVATAFTPVALVVALRTRWPTDAEQAVLSDVLGTTRLRVVDDRTRVGTALAAGVAPGARYVFLTESLFDLLDEEELRAVVAHEVAHHERNHVLLRFALVAVAAGAALAVAPTLSTGETLAVLVLTGVPAAVGFAWVVRETERTADADAARRVSGPALARALERLTSHRYVADATGPVALLSYHPPLAERLAALRDRPAG